MIESIHVKGFQSLHDVSVNLAPFTVIIGHSSSGKSAFTRSVKCLTSNQRGDSFITHGQNQTSIVAKTDKGTVALLRGKRNEYIVIPEDGEQKTYTKLSGTTPEEVSEFIGIPAKDPLNYANQFDMPYLLTASPAEVARTLGELTNVSVIFDASREANKRRLAASGLLKTRAADYESLTKNLEQYRNLKDNLTAIEQAEEAVEDAKRLQTRIARLTSALSILGDPPAVVVKKNFPDITTLREKSDQVERLKTLIVAMEEGSASSFEYEGVVARRASELETLKEKYLTALRLAGVCPTCNQSTEHIHGS